MDVRTLMHRSVRFWGDREAISSGERRLTFSEAWDRGIRMANALLETGLKPGDRVGVLEDNDIGAADFYLACTIANLVRVPLYPRNARESHIHMIGQTGCRVVVVNEAYAPEMKGLVDEISSLEQVIVRDQGYEQWLSEQSDVDPAPDVDEDDWYIIRHTAGTTGKSKGVAYSHRSWLAAGRDWFYDWPPVQPGDKTLPGSPISHSAGYLFPSSWLAAGANHVLDHIEPAGCLNL